MDPKRKVNVMAQRHVKSEGTVMRIDCSSCIITIDCFVVFVMFMMFSLIIYEQLKFVAQLGLSRHKLQMLSASYFKAHSH